MCLACLCVVNGSSFPDYDTSSETPSSSSSTVCIRLLDTHELYCRISYENVKKYQGDGLQVEDVRTFCDHGCYSESDCGPGDSVECPAVEDLINMAGAPGSSANFGASSAIVTTFMAALGGFALVAALS